MKEEVPALPRDNFPRETIDRLARRAGMKCSNPDCRLPTAGPDAGDGTTNTGVAAHIAAASPGGARYDDAMTPEQRSGIANGIWLCQTHAKLIDDDELTYTPAFLHEWKATAEAMAQLEAKGFVIRRGRSFADLEAKAPKLIAEMREDLRNQPLVREFIVIGRKQMYNSSRRVPMFRYYHEEHENLLGLAAILIHYGAIYDIAFNSVPRYNFHEDFVDYLASTG